ncbi:DUF1648 domain-containing protein [Cellulosimicrobium cellulans]|uniref:DUF1648 domain-containing protein n=1 Tax=Cellulosimicrobium cellulans TaxID=1710 RepID=UPI00196575AA|nr:DUF1648 domain-containing protein [Cellulosimicrobium cellulans]MBN0042504.1 DUF1648 domain-containing protein [Cellulosimicrobium cellulans]
MTRPAPRPAPGRPAEDARARPSDHRTLAVVVGGAGAVVTVIAALVALSWSADLPDPVAMHWGSDGADGFGSLGTVVAVSTALGLAASAGFAAMTAFLGRSAANRRVVAGVTVGLPVMLAAVQLGSLWIQRGLADAREVGGVGGVTALALGAGLVVGIAVGALVPGDRPEPTSAGVPGDAPRVALRPGERAAWVGRASGGPALLVAVGAIVVTAALAVALREWAFLLVPVVLALLLAAMLSWVVRVDEGGLSVRSALGFPRTRVPADEVVRADVVAVSPLRDFGGWGWRAGRDGAVGIVVRSGESLRVERTGGPGARRHGGRRRYGRRAAQHPGRPRAALTSAWPSRRTSVWWLVHRGARQIG